MIKVYKFLDDKNTIVRLISNKEEAQALHVNERSLRIETYKVMMSGVKDDRHVSEYKLIGKGIV